MAAFAGDYDDQGEDGFGAPLPPDDRLWRHPSELGSAATLGLDPVAVRRRWLSSPPSKASAWTAGVVGALLATGLVALGTHLATALTAQPGLTGSSSPPTSIPAAVPAANAPGASLAASIHRTGASIAAVQVTRAGHHDRLLGIVIRPDGMVVTPAAYVTGATAVQVTLAGTVPAVATVVGVDRRSGLALLHVNGVTGLPVPHLGSTHALIERSLTLAVTAPGGERFSIGTLTALDSRATVGGLALTDVVSTDVPSREAPPGSALVDASGDVVGMVAGSYRGEAVAVPSWIVGPVVDQLLGGGLVHHGWLGITGTTIGRSGFQPAGVRITDVVPGSAAGIAGLRVGDIVTSIDFQPVSSVVGLLGHLYGLVGGDQVLIGIDRGTADLFYRAVLQGRRPAPSVTG